MFGVLGSGYGIYGYVPSLIASEGSVCLLQKAKQLCIDRVETKDLINQIVWVNTINELYDKSDGLVIAQPPQQQYELINSLFKTGHALNLKRLILEKPLAPTPELSSNLLAQIIYDGISLRVGYIFAYLPWFKELKKIVETEISLYTDILWQFPAYYLINNQETWKRYHSKGGGCLRFYGIHMIALLAMLDFSEVKYSHLYTIKDDMPIKWMAEFKHENGSNMKITIDVNESINNFSITTKKISKNISKNIFKHVSNDIFDATNSTCRDIRSEYIAQITQSFSQPDNNFYKWYDQTNSLWNDIENNTTTEALSLVY